ncbi:MAG: alpha-amylase family glycosyl hydrolase, partial [Myxococcales bacterium]
MTYGFFAPDRRYAADESPGGPTREFKQMVAAFHDAGMEVMLDVVYNHSGEGGTWDATRAAAELTSLRGLDNAAYYALAADPSAYFDSTGCGNNLDGSQAPASRLIQDSLAHWIADLGVDGFRFDEAAELGRVGPPSRAFDPNAPLLTAIARLAVQTGVKIVAEPWDVSAYEVGQFPPGWGEWNGRFRDAVRRYLKSDPSGSGSVTWADAFYGDYDDFFRAGGPGRTVNFVDAHDGFTLADMVSYGS